MNDLRQRPKRSTIQQPTQTTGLHPGRKAAQKGWAIERNTALEHTVEDAETALDIAIEELEASSFKAFLDPSGPLPDDDDYGFEEYEEDSPLADPDGVTDDDAFIGATEFDILSGGSDPDPSPDIIIDEFGHITIPLEDMILADYCRAHNGKALERKAQIYLSNAQDLRRVAEALLEKERDRILGDDTDLSSIHFPYTQKDFMEPLGITGKPRCSKIANRYIKTPHWGVFHLSVFFEGVQYEWRTILDDARKILKKETYSEPYSSKTLWRLVRKDSSPQENQVFRKKLPEAGIPPEKARRDIFRAAEKWVKKNGAKEIQREKIPEIRLVLQKDYKLFAGPGKKRYREEPFIPFVNERIRDILKNWEFKSFRKPE